MILYMGKVSNNRLDAIFMSPKHKDSLPSSGRLPGN